VGAWRAGNGAHREAEREFRAALAIRERVLGPDAPLTVMVRQHLAKSVLELGRLDEAEALMRRALDASARTLGDQDPETASLRVSLADVVSRRGDHEAAEAMQREALAVQERVLSADNPEVDLTRWHLANTLLRQRRLDEADSLATRVLERWERFWPAGHEWTAWGFMLLADIALARGEADRAQGFRDEGRRDPRAPGRDRRRRARVRARAPGAGVRRRSTPDEAARASEAGPWRSGRDARATTTPSSWRRASWSRASGPARLLELRGLDGDRARAVGRQDVAILDRELQRHGFAP
jgi:tetratricopeptide (TPR) repeat protein